MMRASLDVSFIPALILAGMLQVLIPQETVARYFGRQSGLPAICVASVAGVKLCYHE